MQGGWLIAITGNPYLQVQTLGFTHISLLSEAVAFTSHTLECKLADIQFELYLSRSLTFFSDELCRVGLVTEMERCPNDSSLSAWKFTERWLESSRLSPHAKIFFFVRSYSNICLILKIVCSNQFWSLIIGGKLTQHIAGHRAFLMENCMTHNIIWCSGRGKTWQKHSLDVCTRPNLDWKQAYISHGCYIGTYL